MIISDATTWSITYDDTNSKARANKILIIQTSLTIIPYDRQHISIEQATGCIDVTL